MRVCTYVWNLICKICEGFKNWSSNNYRNHVTFFFFAETFVTETALTTQVK